MAFRIGKSVMLNFGSDLEPIFIFIGLAFLLLTGPLLRWYVLGMTKANFQIHKRYYLEILPFALMFLASLFVSKHWFKTNSREVIIVFASALIFIYLHLAFYILAAGRHLKKIEFSFKKEQQTKSQKIVIRWLRYVIVGFIVIWVSYVLNIIEDTIPYVSGPILYSVVVYYLSFKAFQFKITDLDGTVFKKNDNENLFHSITSLVTKKKLYLSEDISLTSLSKLVGKSTQHTSEAINQYANRNFNDFINYYRIQEAKKMLLDKASKNYTISTIAFDAGFSSLSSFNTAFKKFENDTPSSYKKRKLGI